MIATLASIKHTSLFWNDLKLKNMFPALTLCFRYFFKISETVGWIIEGRVKDNPLNRKLEDMRPRAITDVLIKLTDFPPTHPLVLLIGATTLSIKALRLTALRIIGQIVTLCWTIRCYAENHYDELCFDTYSCS